MAPTFSKYQFSEFEVGQVKAHVYHGLSALDISRILIKPGPGKKKWSETAVKKIIDHLEADPKWRGERAAGSGAPRKTTKRQDAAIVRHIEKWRGKKKVTVPYLKKKFLWARKLGDSAVAERLHEAGLVWLRRRRETLVASAYLPGRVAYCNIVKHKHQATLDKWAFSDGTVFYLDRTEEENEQTQRAALGLMVWRRADRTDAVYADCVGPSTYKKAQGIPIRVWGLLALGVLHIQVLEWYEVMNKELYSELIDEKFADWLGSCEYIVQDFESCLRSTEAREAFERVGAQIVEEYPVSSQDFNAIENAWGLLRDRLKETLPRARESRDEFIVRLKEGVVWLNKNRKEELTYLSRNQKERCQDSLALKPPGSRTKW